MIREGVFLFEIIRNPIETGGLVRMHIYIYIYLFFKCLNYLFCSYLYLLELFVFLQKMEVDGDGPLQNHEGIKQYYSSKIESLQVNFKLKNNDLLNLHFFVFYALCPFTPNMKVFMYKLVKREKSETFVTIYKSESYLLAQY